METNEALNLFELEEGYTEEELKKQYKKLALKYHPDKNGGDSEQFQKLGEAYKVLLEGEEPEPFDELEANLKEVASALQGMLRQTFQNRRFVTFEDVYKNNSLFLNPMVIMKEHKHFQYDLLGDLVYNTTVSLYQMLYGLSLNIPFLDGMSYTYVLKSQNKQPDGIMMECSENIITFTIRNRGLVKGANLVINCRLHIGDLISKVKNSSKEYRKGLRKVLKCIEPPRP